MIQFRFQNKQTWDEWIDYKVPYSLGIGHLVFADNQPYILYNNQTFNKFEQENFEFRTTTDIDNLKGRLRTIHVNLSMFNNQFEKFFELDMSKKQFGFKLGLLLAEYKKTVYELYKEYDKI